MKYRRRLKFYSLLRPRYRQSWNKISLYNLARSVEPSAPMVGRTFFQQKWQAKAMTRAYHGEQIKEHQWERMFSRRLPAVVSMDPQYMARHDGSEQAAGRGSGRDQEHEQKAPAPTPYMNMTYAPMERRLDVAVFRALFASSTRQARQFVVHGKVKVNGKKMPYPGYLLNPGDMFQVEIDSVMNATGGMTSNFPEITALEKQIYDIDEVTDESSEDAQEAAPDASDTSTSAESKSRQTEDKRSLLITMDRASTLVSSAKDLGIGEADATVVDAIKRWARYILVLLPKTDPLLSPKTPAILKDSLSNTIAKIAARDEAAADIEAVAISDATAEADAEASAEANAEAKARAEAKALKKKAIAAPVPDYSDLGAEERRRLDDLWTLERSAEPPERPRSLQRWEPRDYMAPFAFVPRYLEVNPTICSAVYLRHPVARQGLAEVPTPFSVATSQLAFNWYLRRR